jgi:hypothetical protein
MNPADLFTLRAAALVVAGFIVGVLTDNWHMVVAFQAATLATAIGIHMIVRSR